ncbi:unnamed protein product [Pylaiella littoralis]
MSPLPAPVERRGSRARRRLLAVDTGLGEAGCDNGVSGLELKREGRGGDEKEDPPVIDTTSVEVERNVDGSVAKVNEYVIIRDIGCGSSAEVKLCQLLIPSERSADLLRCRERQYFANATGADGSGSGCGSNGHEGRHRQGCSAETSVEGQGLWRAKERQGEKEEKREGEAERGSFDNDLYAVKIYDRAELMRRGTLFARPRARDQDGALSPVYAVPEKYIKVVQREIAIMKKLVHPNLVQLVEVIDAPRDRSLYMVMEFVEQGAAMRWVESGRGRYECPATARIHSNGQGGCLGASTAAVYFWDILAGLEYLHQHLVAHRDIKPENVLIGHDGRAKLADFGVSQYFLDDEPRTPKSARSLARSNSRAQMSDTEGTWCFWAPEMCGSRGEKAAFNAYAADAWAVGVTLWCFLYGTVPFISLNPMELFASIAEDPAPVPREADTALRDLFEGLLAKDPGERLTVPEARDHDWVRSRWKGGGAGWGGGGGGARARARRGLHPCGAGHRRLRQAPAACLHLFRVTLLPPKIATALVSALLVMVMVMVLPVVVLLLASSVVAVVVAAAALALAIVIVVVQM